MRDAPARGERVGGASRDRAEAWYVSPMRIAAFALVPAVTLVFGCAAPEEPPSVPPSAVADVVEQGPTRAQAEARAAEEAETPPEPEEPETRSVRPEPAAGGADWGVRLTLSPSAADQAEDGHGHVVAATNPVAIDLHLERGWPGRAVDPVLLVGDLRFAVYEHPEPTVMRFVMADRDALPGGPMMLQWGEEVDSRVAIPRSRVRESGDNGPVGDVRP